MTAVAHAQMMDADRRLPEAGAPPSTHDPSNGPTVAHRVVLVVSGFSLFSVLFAATGPTVRWSPLGLLFASVVVGVVAAIVCGFTARTLRWFGRAEGVLLVAALAALALWTIANILAYTPYRSDEEIFVQYSADLLRHGHNPYTADLMPAYARYPAPFPTKLLDGGLTHSLDYPALPTLLTLALSLAVGTFHTVAVLCTLALMAAAVLVFVLLPRGMRSLAALLVVGIPVLAAGSSGGLLFTLAVAPLAVAAYRWDRTGAGGRLSRTDVVRAAAVGVAASTTQVAWFPLPFLVLGVMLCRERELGRRAALRVTGAFTGVAVLVFLIINAPFIAWGPAAWLRAVFAPITQHAVPEGQGLINLIQSLNIGSGDLGLYTDAGALVMAGLLVAYWRCFDRLKSACFALPLIGLLFPARSYWTYFIAYGAAWMVALLTAEPDRVDASVPASASVSASVSASAPVPHADPDSRASASRALTSRFPRFPRFPRVTKTTAIIVAAFLPAVFVLSAAILQPQPLSITLDRYVTSAQLGAVQTADITVTNRSDQALTPSFMAVHGDGMVSATWNVVSGARTVGAHMTVHYVIVAPSFGAMPSIDGGPKFQAVTASPPTISFSAPLKPQTYMTILTSGEPVTPLLAPRQAIVLTAQAQNALGRAVSRPGMRICLAQMAFANTGTASYRASIAAVPPGDQGNCGFTDRSGRVAFTVTAQTTGGNPLYFQSYGAGGSRGTFGYSSLLTIAWR